MLQRLGLGLAPMLEKYKPQHCIESFKRDDIHKFNILLSHENTLYHNFLP